MKDLYEDKMKQYMTAIQVNEDLKQQVKQQVTSSAMTSIDGSSAPIERVNVMKQKNRDYKKWVAVAAAAVLLLGGGGTIANAATGGAVVKAVEKFFQSSAYENGQEVKIEKTRDKAGTYIIKKGEDVSADEVISETIDGAQSSDGTNVQIAVTKFDENGNEIGSQYSSTTGEEQLILGYDYKKEHNKIMIAFPDYYDTTDKEYLIRKTLLENYYELLAMKDTEKREGCIQSFKEQLEKLQENGKDLFLKNAAKQVAQDIKQDSKIYVLSYELMAKELGVTSETPEDIVDVSWFVVDEAEQNLTKPSETVMLESVAGPTQKVKVTLKKQEKPYVGYAEDVMEPVK